MKDFMTFHTKPEISRINNCKLFTDSHVFQKVTLPTTKEHKLNEHNIKENKTQKSFLPMSYSFY